MPRSEAADAVKHHDEDARDDDGQQNQIERAAATGRGFKYHGEPRPPPTRGRLAKALGFERRSGYRWRSGSRANLITHRGGSWALVDGRSQSDR
ncbi:MAG: hypothetical protein M3Q28_10080 [Pseudomonadota bacterium]|nr:hypothetical protein [Pseudomonadota bacterium]